VGICLERGAHCLHMVQLMTLHPQIPSYLVLFFPRLWNKHPLTSLRRPLTNLLNSDSPSPVRCTSPIGSIDSPLSSPLPGLKSSFSANSSHHSHPFLLQDWLHGFPELFTDASILLFGSTFSTF